MVHCEQSQHCFLPSGHLLSTIAILYDFLKCSAFYLTLNLTYGSCLPCMHKLKNTTFHFLICKFLLVPLRKQAQRKARIHKIRLEEGAKKAAEDLKTCECCVLHCEGFLNSMVWYYGSINK